MRLTSRCHPSVGLDSYCPELVLSSIQVFPPSPAEAVRKNSDYICPRNHVDVSLSDVDERVPRPPALMYVQQIAEMTGAALRLPGDDLSLNNYGICH